MMERILSSKIVVAKDNYCCDACLAWLHSGYTIADCKTDEQRLAVQEAKADKWRILKGQEYRKVVGIQDVCIVTYRARVGMDKVCNDLDMWDN